MTEPTLYVTEKQIIERMGVGIHAGRKAVQAMREHPRFPAKTIGGKRYWPAVRDFLEIWNNRSIASPAIQPGMEQNDGQTENRTGRRRPGLEAAEEWLRSRVGVQT